MSVKHGAVLRSALLLLAPVLVVGCPPTWGSKEWFDRNHQDTLRRRASFDMACPSEQLQFTPLGPRDGYSTVGAFGCGKRSTYVFDQGQWLMNSTDGAPVRETR